MERIGLRQRQKAKQKSLAWLMKRRKSTVYNRIVGKTSDCSRKAENRVRWGFSDVKTVVQDIGGMKRTSARGEESVEAQAF